MKGKKFYKTNKVFIIAAMRLYRSVCLAEYLVTEASGSLVEGENCAQGKWFAESYTDVLAWSPKLGYSLPYYIVVVDIPEDIAHVMYRQEYLDTVGPARFLEPEEFVYATIVDLITVHKL